ncbi:hypothetical protein MFLAVUS_004728 [Mucor flavus]|uniref:Uncharacterized protein n=1 Tax=Mucor flavus TaxID=439312 RepID=A0ABP9YWV9_9FUNG
MSMLNKVCPTCRRYFPSIAEVTAHIARTPGCGINRSGTNLPGRRTNPPATNPPATDIPAIDPPATDPPATDPPATDPPATDPPATNPPTTRPPATNPPATNPPATNPPATDPSATNPPATRPPAADPPVRNRRSRISDPPGLPEGSRRAAPVVNDGTEPVAHPVPIEIEGYSLNYITLPSNFLETLENENVPAGERSPAITEFVRTIIQHRQSRKNKFKALVASIIAYTLHGTYNFFRFLST